MLREGSKQFVVGFLVSVILAGPATAQTAARGPAPDSSQYVHSGNPDSILQSFSPEELIRYREFYRHEMNRLQEELRHLRDRGIRDSEDFLNRHPESKVVDKVLFRLAELYYYKAQEDFQKSMEEYERQLALYDSGKVAEPPEEPRKNYARVLELYQTIVEQFPKSRYVDDALFNMAFLLEDEGKKAEALEVYQRLVDNFPESRYVPDALMRMAEYYFNPPVNQLDKAIELYKRILKFHDTPRYDEALYRLGWSYFRLSDYPQAIAYFTLLADDINLARKYDKAQKISNPALQDESVEYIGISFLDYGGPTRAARYLQEIGDRSYGFTILKKIGDVYLDEKEEYAKAIEAYRVLLSLYPDHPEAPQIQNRIVLAYRKLEDEEMASHERLRLFQYYGENSEWWKKNQNNHDAIRTAKGLARAALADNLGLLLQKAQESDDTTLYREYVEQARTFLATFAGDTLAPQVHWNMALVLDTKLGKRDEAFRQYLALSNTFLGSRYQKMAAENAVALASEIVESRVDSAQRYGPSLSEYEQRLVEAYNNFIRLFPDDEETGLMLANAGALFYNHRMFDDALRYFKTLVKRFPDSPYLEKARMAILESYFGKKDYRSTEIAAKRILTETQNPELRAKAKRRLAEAIFLTADSLAQQGDHQRAAGEFARVAEEVPDAHFADLALFKAGTEYDQAKNYAAAVEAYEKLLEHYGNSKYRLDAMNNLALDYGELERYAEAAVTYERLAGLQPDSVKAQNALYNASVFYVRAKDWRSAIRVNRRFVDRYPNAEEADDLFFDIASYYLKLGELASANQIYGEYAQRFPNSPRVVESYFRRGEYFKQRGDLVQARSEFEKAVQHAEQLRSRGLNTNDYFEAEALFALAEMKLEEYRQIAFKLPESRMRESKRRKTELLKELVESYTKVANFGTQRLYQSTFRIGQVYENYADTWASQEVLETDPARRAVKLKAIDEEAAKLYERAVNSYLKAVSVLEKLAEEYAAKHPDTTTVAETDGKVAFEDTTLEVAQRWITQCKVKVTHVVYKIAEVNFQAARRLLAAPVPKELGPLAELEYWHQLYSKAVAPIVQRTLAHHERNLALAQKLNVQSEWVDRSRHRIAEVSVLVANGYQTLADSALARYARFVQAYAELLPKADSSADLEGQVYDLATQVGHYLDYTKSFASISQQQYQVAFASLDTIASLSRIVQDYADSYLESSFRFAERCDSLAAVANQWKDLALKLQKRTGSYIWEDGSLTFEDAHYALEGASRTTLESAFAVADTLNVSSPWVGEIVLTLIQKDPEKYASVLGLNLDRGSSLLDNTWQAVLVDSLNPDSALTEASIVCVDTLQLGDSSSVPVGSILLPDSMDSALASVQGDSSRALRLKLSRTVSIQGLPADGKLEILCSLPYDLFVNGQYIAHVPGDTTAKPAPHVHNLREFLNSGQNVIEIWLAAKLRTEPVRLAARLDFDYLPDWEKQKRRLGLAWEDRELQRMLYFDKNLIPDWQLSGGGLHEQELATHDFDNGDPAGTSGP